MKLSKKILLAGTALLAFGLGFVGCAVDEDPHGILKIKGDTANVEYSNTTEITHRGFKTLKTKHTDAVAIMNFDEATAPLAGETSDANAKFKAGVFGFIFDLQEKKLQDGPYKGSSVYDFTTVSVRRYNNQLQTYISRFENISTADNKLDGGDNFKGVDGQEAKTTTSETWMAKETEYLKGSSGAYANIANVDKTTNAPEKSKTYLKNNNYQVAVEVKATDSGTYEVKFYKIDAVKADSKKESIKNELTGQNEQIETGEIDSSKSSSQLAVSGSNDTSSLNNSTNAISIDASWKTSSNKSVDNQQKMGFYAAVYPKYKLVGSIQLPYILNEAEVVEWED